MCWKLGNTSSLDTFPSLSISMKGGVSISIPPRHLFVNMIWDDHGKAYCLAIYPGAGRRVLLGANAMMGHDYIFDIKAKQLGIAPANCRKPDDEAGFDGSSKGKDRGPIKPPHKSNGHDNTGENPKNPAGTEKHSTGSADTQDKETKDASNGASSRSSTSNTDTRTRSGIPSANDVYISGIAVGVAATAFTVAIIVLVLVWRGIPLIIGSYEPVSSQESSSGEV